MSRLSANTLFHFTNSKDNLISILKSNFQPRYCEEVLITNHKTKWHLPMVCFCDIPLSQIEEHVTWYGEYAIGMNKEWAVKENINPVFYLNKDTAIVKAYKDVIKFFIENFSSKSNLNNQINKLGLNVLYQYSYFKLYEGKQYHKLKKEKLKKRFYDEREWRYIPITDEINSYIFNKSLSTDQIKELNNSIKEHAINFEPKYINYIIVSKEDEVLTIKREIEKIKQNYQPEDIELLTTRIMSMERIREDF